MKKQYKVKPTKRQIRAVDGIISGRHKMLAPAMREAGYSESAIWKAKTHLIQRRGVQVYLQQLNDKAKKLWNMSLPEKVMEGYLEGISATKLFGKDAIEHPDYVARKTYLDAFAKFFQWIQPEPVAGSRYAQFNFFSISEKKRKQFNLGFSKFLDKFYKNKI